MKDVGRMTDPFRSQARAERLKAVSWILLIAALLALAFILSRARDVAGRTIEGRVIEFGIVAGKYGDRSIVKVRLADGSIRQVMTSPNVTSKCEQGDRIALVERGTSLIVEPQGCDPRPQ